MLSQLAGRAAGALSFAAPALALQQRAGQLQQQLPLQVAATALLPSALLSSLHNNIPGLAGSRAYSSGHDDDKPSTSGRGDQDEPHAYFPGLSQSNRFQVQLERAEVEKGGEGLMASDWSDLYVHPRQRVFHAVFGKPIFKLQDLLMGPMVQRVSSIATRMIQNEVEADYDKEEFLEGAQGAFKAVTDAYGRRAWQELRQMCSERVVERMQVAVTELKAEHGLALEGLEVLDVQRIMVTCANLWTAQSMAHFEPSAPQQVEVNTSNSWLVVTVHFEATVRAQYETGGQAGEAEGGGGEGEGVIKTCTMQKRGAWLFSRGPLPRGGSKTLSLPWKVVAWW